MLTVPNKYRIRRGPLASVDADGDNGAFLVPGPLGDLTVIASDGAGWSECNLPGAPWEHVSVSTPHRTPTWKEMAFIKDLFWGPDAVVMQLHVGANDYVNNHAHCLHLWRPTVGTIPLPPSETVGDKNLGTIHK